MYKVRFCSIDTDMVSAWKTEFKDYPKIDIFEGDIFSKQADAVVSPGNSFGLMDAGLDKLMRNHFGPRLEMKLQAKIKADYHGELPVGIATILKTGDEKFPYFISSPTMRVPMRLKDSVNVYLATRAVFVAIDDYDPDSYYIHSVIIPGMGVGSGKMPYDIAARQMRRAYENIILGKTNFPSNWEEAVRSHKNLRD